MKIFIKAKTGAKEEKIKEDKKNHFIISIKERPIKGKANSAIEKAIARHFGVSSSRVKIVYGAKSKEKIAEIL